MTRKATMPMNRMALLAANVTAKKQFSPIPQPGDPTYGDFQKVWMDTYIAKGGAFVEDTPQQAKQNAQSARMQTASLTNTADATAPCPNASSTGPGTLAAPAVDCTCKLIGLNVSCEHGRTAKDGLLQVVSTDISGDKITIAPSAQGDCAEKLVTRVSGIPSRSLGETSFPHKGTSSSQFKAYGPKRASYSLTALPTDSPLVSVIDASACGGNAQSVRIETFPAGVRKIELNVSRIIEGVTGGFGKLPISDLKGFTKKGTTRKIARKNEGHGLTTENIKSAYNRDAKEGDGPSVAIKAELQWKEENNTNLVYNEGSIWGGLDPLFGGNFSILLYGVPIPRKLKKYITAGIYLNVSGKLTLGLRCTWVFYPAPKKLRRFDSGSGELKGEIKAELAAELFVYSDKCLNAKAAGSAAIEFTGAAKVTHKQEFWLEYNGSFGALKAAVVVKAAWGLLEFEREWPIFEGFPHSARVQVLE